MILLDDRTLQHTTKGFVNRFNGLATVTRLDYGDAVFYAKDPLLVAVEIKRGQDLLDSIRHTGRLLEQIRKALQEGSVDHYVLLLWGDFGRDDDGLFCERHWVSVGGKQRYLLSPVIVPGTSDALTYREVDNFLNSLEILNGIQVKWARDEAEVAQVVIDQYFWWQKRVDGHKTTLSTRFYTPDFLGQGISLVRRVAKELPGIGPDRSLAVEQVFPSVEAMVRAGEREWRGVEGIGKVIAQRVVHAAGWKANGGTER